MTALPESLSSAQAGRGRLQVIRSRNNYSLTGTARPDIWPPSIWNSEPVL